MINCWHRDEVGVMYNPTCTSAALFAWTGGLNQSITQSISQSIMTKQAHRHDGIRIVTLACRHKFHINHGQQASCQMNFIGHASCKAIR